MTIGRTEAVEVLKTLQFAIVDLSAIREAEKEVLSAADLENADYVIGMATLTSANLERVLAENDDGAEGFDGVVEQFVGEARGFANALTRAGIGLAS